MNSLWFTLAIALNSTSGEYLGFGRTNIYPTEEACKESLEEFNNTIDFFLGTQPQFFTTDRVESQCLEFILTPEEE